MVEIIPSINVRTFNEVKERITKVEPYVKWCHLDITDGVFSKHLTWNNPRDLLNLRISHVLKFEVHLMVQEPEKVVDEWLIPPIERVIVHLEAIKDLDGIIKKCREKEIEVGLAINPETTWENLWPYFEKVDLIQTLAVNPGPSGQELQEEIYDKIINIRKYCEKCIIEVDGGINVDTAKKAKEIGANLLVAGNYIFNSESISDAIKKLL